MRERGPQSSPPPPEPERRSWDAATIAGELGVPAEPRLDPLHGKGTRFQVGESPAIDLELFPAAHIVRLSAPDFSVNLVQETAPRLAPHGVIFEASKRALLIAPSGETLLRIGRPKPAETAAAPAEGAKEPMTRDVGDEGLLDDLAAAESASRGGVETAKETQAREPRVRLAGRLGTEIRYRTTRNNQKQVKNKDGTTRLVEEVYGVVVKPR